RRSSTPCCAGRSAGRVAGPAPWASATSCRASPRRRRRSPRRARCAGSRWAAACRAGPCRCPRCARSRAAPARARALRTPPSSYTPPPVDRPGLRRSRVLPDRVQHTRDAQLEQRLVVTDAVCEAGHGGGARARVIDLARGAAAIEALVVLLGGKAVQR